MKTLMLAFATVCAAGMAYGAGPFTQCPGVGSNPTGCNLLITVTAVNTSGAATSFTVTTSTTDVGPFDGSEDTLIGITNASSGVLKSIFLTGGAGSGVFFFDNDGACPAGSYSPSPTATQCGTTTQNPTGYGSANASFTGISTNFDSGTVLTGGTAGLNPGQSTWFDLEGVILANQIGATTPAPSSILLMLTALAGLGLYFLKRRMASPSVS